jgi:hypothetical protein
VVGCVDNPNRLGALDAATLPCATGLWAGSLKTNVWRRCCGLDPSPYNLGNRLGASLDLGFRAHREFEGAVGDQPVLVLGQPGVLQIHQHVLLF